MLHNAREDYRVVTSGRDFETGVYRLMTRKAGGHRIQTVTYVKLEEEIMT
jgi:hypothetical protein